MLNEKNAVIILWTGNKMPDTIAERIATLLCESGVTIPEWLKVVYMDEAAVSKAMLRNTAGKETFVVEVPNNEEEAIKKSVEYIGTRFASELKDPVKFAVKLYSELSRAKSSIKFEPECETVNEKALVNAVGILATASRPIPPTLTRKYHITTSVIDIIRHVYITAG